MTNTPARSLAARARESSNDPLLSIRLRSVLNECADRLDAMRATAIRRNRTIRRMRRTIDRIANKQTNERTTP